MISGQDLLNRRSRAGGRTFLSATDPLVRRSRSVEFVVRDIRESPQGINAPAMVDFDRVIADGEEIRTDKTSLTLNMSNVRRLTQVIGDDISKVRGGTIICTIEEVNNPNYHDNRPFDELSNNPVTVGWVLVDVRTVDGGAPPAPPAPAAAAAPPAGRSRSRR